MRGMSGLYSGSRGSCQGDSKLGMTRARRPRVAERGRGGWEPRSWEKPGGQSSGEETVRDSTEVDLACLGFGWEEGEKEDEEGKVQEEEEGEEREEGEEGEEGKLIGR